MFLSKRERCSFFHFMQRCHICSLAVARTNGRVMQTLVSPLSCLNTWASWHWTASWGVRSATTATVKQRGEFIQTFSLHSQFASAVWTMNGENVDSNVHLRSHFSGTNAYIKAVYELSSLVSKRFRTFPYHNDLIFYLSPHGFRYRKALKVAHSHTGRITLQ